ncbi:MAG: NfeD family protein [Syntrophomonadaceae bacterium]|jgi:membrane protein implicated in regulation of membrane protease activity
MTTLEWILVAIVCGTIEIFSLGLWFLWLAISAAFIALLVSLGILSTLESQLLIFAFATLILIIFTRPLALRLFKTEDTVSNVQALVGQHGVTLSSLGPLEYGQVKVRGEVWTAFANEEIEADTRVTVTGINGVKLAVEKTEE